jgi:hypothetical protein
MGRSDSAWLASAWAVLALGLLFRLLHYLSNHSLWLDEAMFARNILDRGPLDLLRPLSDHQTAPVVVRLLIDTATVLFGPDELALRLVPFLASLVSVFLCLFIGQTCLEKRFLVVFMAMVSFSYPLVYYAQQVKPYAIDVAVALTLIYAVLRLRVSANVTPARVAVLGVSGSMAIGLSHTAIFVLAGIGVSLLVISIPTHDRRFLAGLVGIFVLWMFTFSIYYWLFLRSLNSDTFLHTFFTDGFLPVPTSLDALQVWGGTMQSFLQYIGYPLPWTIFIAALLTVSVADALSNRRLDICIVLVTIVVTLVASTMHLYPLVSARTTHFAMSYGRMSLFLVPLLYLLMVRGLQTLAEKRRLCIGLLLSSVLLVPSLSSALLLSTPMVRQEVRPVLHYLREHLQPDDQIYVYYRDPHAVKYYQRDVQLPEQNIHWGRYSIRQPQLREEIEAMQQWPRVWFLFSHRHEDEEIQLLSHLDGELLDQYYAPGVSVYLYQFASGPGGAVDESKPR